MTPRPEKGLWRWHVGALAIYSGLAVGLIDHGASLTRNVLGMGSDPFAFIWFLAWWPWSIAHHLSPLHAYLIWQPLGIGLPWTTSVPFLALLGLPATLLSGPVLTYNILTIAAPLLSAFCAYMLCLRITGAPAAAMAGGFLFGFSTYEMSETLCHLNLDFTAAIPCLLLVVLNRLDGRLSRLKAALYAGILLCVQFYVSVEVFATTVFFGGLGWCLALAMLPARRAALLRLFADGLVLLPFVLLCLSPFLWAMLAYPRDVVLPAGWSYMGAVHFGNLLVPTADMVVRADWAGKFKYSLIGGFPQSDLTTGLVLLFILILYFYRNWQDVHARFLFSIFLVLLVASLGPQLWFGNMFTSIVLPWRAMMAVPLLNSALPVRFAVYSSLVMAIIVVLWICEKPAGAQYKARIGVGLLACLLMLPPLHPAQQVPSSRFFSAGEAQRHLTVQDRILILPEQNIDPSSFWQAENDFGFSQTTGYLGMPPKLMLADAAVRDLAVNMKAPDLGSEIKDLCLVTRTEFVVAGPGTPAALLRQMKKLSWTTRQIDDVVIFTVPLNSG